MTNNIIADLSMDFSVSIVNLCDSIKGKSAIVNQLLRSGTSIGANIHEANYASSRADFVAKMQISLKECYETEYWLELFVKTNMITEEQYKTLKNACGKIRKLLIASINTQKQIHNKIGHIINAYSLVACLIFCFKEDFRCVKGEKGRGWNARLRSGACCGDT